MLLLVVDTQKGCFNENLFAFETVEEAIEMMKRGIDYGNS